MAVRYLLVVLCTICGVWGFETGPPIDQFPNLCRDMVPTGHQPRNATGASPYRVTSANSTYSPGKSLKVIVEAIDGTTEIEGLFVQARRSGQGKDKNKAIGEFAEPPTKTKLLKCGHANSAWAHSAELEATAAEVTWKAPPCDEGPLVFMATIVKGPKEMYWTGVLSTELTFSGTEGAECSAAPTSASVSGIAMMMSVVLALCLAVFKNYN
ncbi:putative defense protein 3 [Patiria miniata]|uniref:Reelin domain-containing protein n=1 Tax=Patiria miniata TaxID=46514 RepID=A0A914AZ67_PATMI|nr:putative defense protein 3 [Patiria miniata]